MSAASVPVSTATPQGAGAGPTPSTALHSLQVKPIPFVAARRLLVRQHYLHTLPGGTKLTFGVFCGGRLMGAISLGAGPYLAYQLVEGASPDDCICLTRLWLADELPKNSESRAIAVIIRALKHNTGLKFLVAYSDPAVGHLGIIYQATGWLYTGLSSSTPLYDLGDGVPQHSRSLAHAYGTHSLRYFSAQGLEVKLVAQSQKHRYIYFLDPAWCSRLNVPVLPYPKKEAEHGHS